MNKEILKRLIHAGHLRRFPAEVWKNLSKDECKSLCSKALQNPPLTFIPASLTQKNTLRSYMAQGLLEGFERQDVAEVTSEDADILIEIAKENSWKKNIHAKSLEKECSDIGFATEKQLKTIRDLIHEKHLHQLSGNTLQKLSKLSAKRLIWRGLQNKKETSYVLDQ